MPVCICRRVLFRIRGRILSDAGYLLSQDTHLPAGHQFDIVEIKAGNPNKIHIEKEIRQ